MRVLLVNPDWVFYPGTNRRPGGPPTTLAVVAAALRPHCDDVRIFDFMATDATQEFEDKLLWGKPFLDFLAEIETYQPDAIGFSSTWTVQHTNTQRLGEMVNDHFPQIKTFCGGHHVTVAGITQPYMDYTVLGEIEPVAKELMTALRHDGGGLITSRPAPDLDALPIPAYDLLDTGYYLTAQRNHHGSRILGGMPVTTSRGCPYGCNFCTVRLVAGRQWRAQSADYVKRHISHVQRLGFSGIHFEDDNLLLDRYRWIEVMRWMESDGGIRWDTPNGVRLDHLNQDMLKLAADSGCVELRVSIETASDAIRNEKVGKNLKINRIEHVAQWCKELGIVLGAFYVVGIPGETMEDMRNTLRLAQKLESAYGVVPRYSIATPFPGTAMLEECRKNGWLNVTYPYSSEQLAGGTHLRGLITTPEFTPESINEAYAEWKGGRL